MDALYIQNNSLGNTASEQLLCYKIASNSSVTHTLRHIDLSNCNLGYNGAIHFSRISEHWHRLESANLSNNVIDDRGAMAIANAFFHGKFPQLKGLDFHGNKISAEGYGYFAKVLETVPRQIQTKDIAITMEVHAEQRTAWEFVKHAAKYITDAHSKEMHAVNKELLVAMYGDSKYAVCIKALGTASTAVAVGMIKKSANPVAAKALEKAPGQSKLGVLAGIFALEIKDSWGSIVTTDLIECIGVLTPKTTADEFIMQPIGDVGHDLFE